MKFVLMSDRIGTTRSRNRIGMRVALATVSCLLLRATIPLGFMPGNVLAGEFVVLCPAGLPADTVRQLHHDHAGHDEKTVDMDARCPIGTALQYAAAPPAKADAEAGLSSHQHYIVENLSEPPAQTSGHTYFIRGPPRI